MQNKKVLFFFALMEAVYYFVHFYLMLTRLEVNAGLMPLVKHRGEDEWCRILTKMQLLEWKCWAIDWLFKFPIQLNALYLDTKSVRARWESTQALVRVVEALLNPAPQTQIAALTLLNITLLCSTLFWQTSVASVLTGPGSPCCCSGVCLMRPLC